MSDTESALIKKSVHALSEEKTDNPKSLLVNFVQLNETVPPSQPDDSPTVTNVKQKAKRRSSRRSSGIRALTQTPHNLLRNFVENAPEETPVKVDSSVEASVVSVDYLISVPQKISKMVVDDQNESSEYEEEIVRKMPRIRHKAVLEKFSVTPKQEPGSPGEDSSSEIKQLPSRTKKIRNKITVEDIASGIKLSQEKAAETGKSFNITEVTKAEVSSLHYISINTENLESKTPAVEETPQKIESLFKCEEKDDSLHSKPEKNFKRKRSVIKGGYSNVEVNQFINVSDEEEETLQKVKMLRLKTDAEKLTAIKDERPAEVEKVDIPILLSEEKLTDVAYTVEVYETRKVCENVDKVGHSKIERDNFEIEESAIVENLNEINKLLQDEIINTGKLSDKGLKEPNEALPHANDIKNTNSDASDESNEHADETDSRTCKECPTTSGINLNTFDNKDAQSKKDVVAIPYSSKGDNSDVHKASDSKEYMDENVDSSYVEESSWISELKKDITKEHPFLVGDSVISDINLQIRKVVQRNSGALSPENFSVVSHKSSLTASQASRSPVQSNDIAAEEKEHVSKKSSILIEEKEKNKELSPLVAGNVSMDEQDELFPSSPKETTSSEHSRSSSPASSEIDKTTQHLTLPSSKSAFVEMKSISSNVVPSTSRVLTKKVSSIKKSYKKKSLEQLKNKSYQMMDSVASTGKSVPNIEALHVTKNAQILSQSPFHTMISSPQITEKHVAPEPQRSIQIAENTRMSSRKQKVKDFSKKYIISPKITHLLLQHYSGLNIPTACLPELGKLSDQFFDNLFETLSSYATHASRRKLEYSDIELYFQRVGWVNKNKNINTLIREYLPLEDQQFLIPVARSGNVISGILQSEHKK